MEPRPSKPSNGSGEAVCGRFAPAFLSDVALFCALTSPDVELLGVLALLLCALVSELVAELLGGVVEVELLGAALFCALISELLVVEVLVELLGAAALFCALVLLWSEVVEAPVLPTPLELAACEGVAVDGGVFCVCAAVLS
jgi:hypothetical protein